MARFSERQSLLLQLLSEVERPLTGQELAALLGISPRTLRYDIARINRVFRGDLVVSGGQGYQMDRGAYQAIVADEGPLTIELGHEERLLLYLLDHPVTDLYDMVVECYLGESVVRSTLRRLQGQLAARDVSLTLRGSQVRLAADEQELRRVLGRLVRRAMDTAGGRSDHVAGYLPLAHLSSIEQQLRDVLARHHIVVDDIRLENLVITTAICVQRSEHAAPGSVEVDPESRAWRAIADLATQLARLHPDRPLAPTDQQSLVGLLQASLEEGHGPEPTGGVVTHDEDDFSKLLGTALDETAAHFRLTIQRDKLYNSLEGHLRRMLRRVGAPMYFRNSLQESLRSRSPFLYDIAVFLADRISRQLNVRFTDDEIGLLAIYFGLYTQQRGTDKQSISAVIVCPRYQTLRDWLLAGIVERYSTALRVVDVVGSPAEADALDCDLIITTIDVASFAHPSVQVSAVLSDLDVGAVDAAIARVRRVKARGRAIETINRFLDPDLFFVGQHFTDATETIQFLSKAMETRGIVPPEYLDSALLRETYSSTAFARRFAIPHAMEFMAHRTKVAVVIPSSPIQWEVADVSLVLMLAINGQDYDDFVEFYQPLVRVLYDPQLFSELRKVATFERFRDLLGEHLALS